MKQRFVLFLILFITFTQISAQEFNCDIRVSAQSIEGTDRRVFEALQTSLYEFMNNRKWSNINIKNQERIECSILITIKERISSDEYKATLNLVLRRPVFNASYNTILLNYVDEYFQFRYIESQTLEYNENSFNNNLTSTLAYYAYMFLGLDFDSYSLYGGDPFYKAAESIVNSAQNATEKGWKAFDSNRNRYWMVENLQNASYRPIRQFIYEFHRLGLDVMSEKPDEGRAKIGETLAYLNTINSNRPGLFILQLMIDAKRDEIIKVYSKGSAQEKTKAVNIMREIDPANSSSYEKILAK